MPTASTRATLLRDICAALHDGEGFPAVGTSSGLGSSTTLLDAVALLYADSDADALGNPVLRIDELVGAGPAAGSYATVRDGGLAPTTGIITVSPAFSGAVQAGTDYSLWKVCHPSVAERALNRMMRRLRREVIVPISALSPAHSDFDAAVSWSVVANALLFLNTTVVDIRHGAGSAQILGSGGAPTVQSEEIRCVEGEQWLLSAAGRANSGVMTLAAYDSTNAANIATASHDEEQFLELLVNGGYFTIPTGCEGLRARVSGTGAADDLYLDDVILWPAKRKWWTLPSYVEDFNDIVSVGYFPHARSLVGTNAYQVDEEGWVPWPYKVKPHRIDEGGAAPFQVELATPVIRPLFCRLRRPFPELTTDTATTTADRELVVALTLREVYRILRTQARERKDGEAEKAWSEAIMEVNRQEAVHAFDSRFGAQELIVVAPRRRGRRR